MATRVLKPSVRFLNGSDTLQFYGGVADAAGRRREVEIDVPASLVVDLARYLAPVLNEEDSGARGHAIWHWSRPAQPYPCPQCRLKAPGP